MGCVIFCRVWGLTGGESEGKITSEIPSSIPSQVEGSPKTLLQLNAVSHDTQGMVGWSTRIV